MSSLKINSYRPNSGHQFNFLKKSEKKNGADPSSKLITSNWIITCLVKEKAPVNMASEIFRIILFFLNNWLHHFLSYSLVFRPISFRLIHFKPMDYYHLWERWCRSLRSRFFYSLYFFLVSLSGPYETKAILSLFHTQLNTYFFGAPHPHPHSHNIIDSKKG